MIFADVFGKSASSIINLILSNNDYTSEDFLSKVNLRCKASHDDILNAVKGISFTDHQKAKISIVKKHMEYVNSLLDEIQMLINETFQE